MKILVVTIVIFALSGCVTRVSSQDPFDAFEVEDAVNHNYDDSRSKRSGAIFSSLMKKKLKLLGSLSGSSSSKSIDHHPSGHSTHFEQPPVSYHTKSFDLWGVKKAIISSVLQAAKAITGGVIALKGQLIKAKGHAVVAKGKLLQTKGQAISNFGQTIATHAFDEHHEPPQHHVEVHSSVGLYNHLPVPLVHQSSGHGAPPSSGGGEYQEQVYPNNGYHQDDGYHGSPRYPTAPSSTGYEGGSSDYSGFGGNSYSAKRAVQHDGHKLTINQLNSGLDKEAVRAGLLLFKPIKLPQTFPGGGNSPFQSSGLQHFFSHQPAETGKIFPQHDYQTPVSQETIGHPNTFLRFRKTPTSTGGGYTSYQTPTYPTQQDTGYSSQAADYVPYPPNDGISSDSGERVSVTPNHHNNYRSQGYKTQESTVTSEGQEFGSHEGGGFSGQQQQQQQQQRQQSYPHENSYDQNDSASMSQEHGEQVAYTVIRSAENPARNPIRPNTATFTKSERFAGDFFLPTTPKYNNDRPVSSIKRSVPKGDDLVTVGSVEPASIVPSKYHSDSSRAAEEQDKLKQTVQRFFSLLQQQRCKMPVWKSTKTQNNEDH